MTKAEIANEIYSRMNQERTSAKPGRGAEQLDSSQIAKTTGIDKAAVVTVIEQFITVVNADTEPKEFTKEEIAQAA